MKKKTIRDRLILCIIAVAIGVFGCVKLVWQPMNSKIVNMKNEKSELKLTLTDKSPLDQKLKQLHSDNESLVNQISEIKIVDSAKTLTKEEFLVFLSDAASKSNAEIIKFNDLGIENENGVWKTTFDFQIRGTFKNINAVCERIDITGIRYSIGSMSLRQNEQYPYLERNFDSFSNLEWYTDPVKPKEDVQVDTEEEENILPPNEIAPDKEPTFPEPVPEPTMPSPTPPPTTENTPEPTPDTDNGNITDRLNDLLELTNYSASKYEIKFLTNTVSLEPSFLLNTSDGDVMTLTITLQLVMFEEPIAGSSIIITEEGETDNAIL